jgi:hypothetical protein
MLNGKNSKYIRRIRMISNNDTTQKPILETQIYFLNNEVNWCRSLLQHIVDHCNNDKLSPTEKVHAVGWLAKQGLKGIKEE